MSELPSPSLIAELEARQDAVLRQLDALNARLEGAIAQFLPSSGEEPVRLALQMGAEIASQPKD